MRGGKMSYMKLLKLLYLVDREALLRWGRPVSTDRYVSMDIEYGDILRAGNKTEVEIESILQELRNIAHPQDCLQTY